MTLLALEGVCEECNNESVSRWNQSPVNANIMVATHDGFSVMPNNTTTRSRQTDRQTLKWHHNRFDRSLVRSCSVCFSVQTDGRSRDILVVHLTISDQPQNRVHRKGRSRKWRPTHGKANVFGIVAVVLVVLVAVSSRQ